MKIQSCFYKTLLLCLAGFIPQYSGTAQNINKAGITKTTPNIRKPARNARIVNFSSENRGPLHIYFNDGTNIEIPLEQRQFGQQLRQESFNDIQIAEDGKHIGWLAAYMCCAQNYPCNPELVIFQPGKKLIYITPPYGVMWDWKFLRQGKQVLAHSGFPHGDENGVFTIYDAETGHDFGSPQKDDQ